MHWGLHTQPGIALSSPRRNDVPHETVGVAQEAEQFYGLSCEKGRIRGI